MVRLPLALLLAASVALAGCSSGNEGHSGDTVEVGDDSFEPERLEVEAGTEVHFESEGTNLHSVTIHMVGDPVDTTKTDEDVQEGGDVHYTFATAGTYHVWCKYHGTMTSGMAMVVEAS